MISNFDKDITTKQNKLGNHKHGNLLKKQLKQLTYMKNHPDFIIWPADKNLGPCVIERKRYIKLALEDHLQHQDIYGKLKEKQLHNKAKFISKRKQHNSFTLGVITCPNAKLPSGKVLYRKIRSQRNSTLQTKYTRHHSRDNLLCHELAMPHVSCLNGQTINSNL